MKLLLVGLVFGLAVHAANSACVPGAVTSMSFDGISIFKWSEPLNPNNCTIKTYIVKVTNNEDGVVYQYDVNNLTYIFKDLDMCQKYTFEVQALTNESVLGPAGSQLPVLTYPPEDINLNLHILNATTLNTTDSIFVAWNLSDPETRRCIAYYRVAYWNDYEDPKDEYVTEESFILDHDIQGCRAYYFEVNAIVTNLRAIEGPISEAYVASVGKEPSVPTIVSLDAVGTTVNMVWKLESYDQNHCSLVSLDVYTLGAPANASHVSIPITDSLARDDVSVTITGLEENHVYTSLVSVTNEVGSSKNVTVTFQTT